MKKIIIFIVLLSVTFLTFGMKLESIGSYEESSYEFFLSEHNMSSAINSYCSIDILYSSFMFDLIILVVSGLIFLVALSVAFWGVKIKLSKTLSITYNDREMSIFADLVIFIFTPLTIFFYAVDSNIKLKLLFIVILLLVLNVFAFVKKESIKKYIILTFTLLIVLFIVFFASMYLYSKYFL